MVKEILLQKKNAIVGKWINSIVKTYPIEAADFLHLQKDRFANPIGHIISVSAENLFDEVINEFNTESIKKLLFDIIRMRAVQSFSPSQATGFVFSLKQAIYSELDNKLQVEGLFEELMIIDYRIDKMALTAFDLYSEAREKIHQIRMKEAKSRMQHDKFTHPGEESNLQMR